MYLHKHIALIIFIQCLFFSVSAQELGARGGKLRPSPQKSDFSAILKQFPVFAGIKSGSCSYYYFLFRFKILHIKYTIIIPKNIILTDTIKNIKNKSIGVSSENANIYIYVLNILTKIIYNILRK